MWRNKPKKNMFIGIDLGTTFSAVARVAWIAETKFKPQNIPVFKKSLLLPTIVDFSPTYPEIGRRVGKDKDFVVTGFQFKSKIGTDKPFNLPDGRQMYPRQVALEILKYLRERIEQELQINWETIKVALAFPAFRPDKQADRSEVFWTIAKRVFPSVVLIEEPIAALVDVDYKNNLLSSEDKIILLVDYGGGTCDVAVIRAGYSRFFKRQDKGEVLSVASKECGGQFIDGRIAEWLAAHGHQGDKIQLMEQARVIKERICSGKNIEKYPLTPAELDALSKPIIEAMFEPIETALEDAQKREERRKRKFSIDKIILTGGASKHPLVKELIKERYPSIEIIHVDEPQLNVSRGAALYGFYEEIGQLNFYSEIDRNLVLHLPNGKRRRLAHKGQQVPFEKANRFVFKVTQPTDAITLKLYADDEKYKDISLEFDNEVLPGSYLYLEVEVHLRNYVYIVGCVSMAGAQQECTEKVIRTPL